MLNLDQMREIEHELGFSYPPSFVGRAEELVALSQEPRFTRFMPRARFLTSTVDLRAAYGDDLPSEFIPFLVAEQPAHVDYYVFDTNTNPPEFQVAVFAIHAVVKNWDSFESFYDWLKQCSHA